MTVLLQACAIVAAPMLAFGFYAIWSAPLGYEDDAGFHVLGIGGGELRNLRETHGERNTIA